MQYLWERLEPRRGRHRQPKIASGTETLVCLSEQRSRRVMATFLQMVQEGL